MKVLLFIKIDYQTLNNASPENKQRHAPHFGGYTRGEMLGWSNPYGLNVPVIVFTQDCKKCHGTGVCKSTFTGTPLPCTICYTRQGFCQKCYGTGKNYRNGKICGDC